MVYISEAVYCRLMQGAMSPHAVLPILDTKLMSWSVYLSILTPLNTTQPSSFRFPHIFHQEQNICPLHHASQLLPQQICIFHKWGDSSHIIVYRYVYECILCILYLLLLLQYHHLHQKFCFMCYCFLLAIHKSESAYQTETEEYF